MQALLLLKQGLGLAAVATAAHCLRTPLSGASLLQALLEEYLGSGDTAEAARCLHDLTVPLYHHEMVKRALLMALDPTGHHAASLFGLLAKLAASGEVNQVCARARCCHTCCSLVPARQLGRAGPDCCLWGVPAGAHPLHVLLRRAVVGPLCFGEPKPGSV